MSIHNPNDVPLTPSATCDKCGDEQYGSTPVPGDRCGRPDEDEATGALSNPCNGRLTIHPGNPPGPLQKRVSASILNVIRDELPKATTKEHKAALIAIRHLATAILLDVEPDDLPLDFRISG